MLGGRGSAGDGEGLGSSAPCCHTDGALTLRQLIQLPALHLPGNLARNDRQQGICKGIQVALVHGGGAMVPRIPTGGKVAAQSIREAQAPSWEASRCLRFASLIRYCFASASRVKRSSESIFRDSLSKSNSS